MAQPTHFVIRNWAKYQHYKDRNPPWVKLHMEMLASEDWVTLADASRLIMIICMMVAAKNDGRVPNNPAYIKRLCYLDKRPDLMPLIKSGFLVNPLACASNVEQALADARPEKEAEAEADTEQNISRASLEREHEEFWKLVPLKKSKGQSLKAYLKARKDGATAEELASGMRRYATERSGQDPKFTKHPATWLNGKCWLDDTGTPAAPVEDPLAIHRTHLKTWAASPKPPDSRFWPDEWGPPPHKPDTKVPREVLKEFGIAA